MSLDRLKQVFVLALGLPPDVRIDTLEYQTTPEWDSVGHMELVLQLETAFGISLETEDVLDLKSFHRTTEILTRHGVVLDA